MVVSRGSSYQQAEFPLTFRQYLPAYLRGGSGCRRAKHTGHKEFTHCQLNFPVIPSLRRSLRLRCLGLEESEGLAGSFDLIGGGPLPPLPPPPPENNAILLAYADPPSVSIWHSHNSSRLARSAATVSRSRVERASSRHSRARGITGQVERSPLSAQPVAE